MQKKTALSAIALSSLLAFSLVQAGAADPVKTREGIMKAMGKNMKAMAAMTKGEKPFDAATFAVHAKAVADEAGKDLVAQFPAGSGKGSEAKPEIWQNMDDFKARADALKEKADALVTATATGDKAQMTAAQGEVGKVCKGCHEKYKAD